MTAKAVFVYKVLQKTKALKNKLRLINQLVTRNYNRQNYSFIKPKSLWQN